MLATQKKLKRAFRERQWALTWPWVGLAALSGVILSTPVILGRWRRRSDRRQEDRMDAYVRGCLDGNRGSS